MKLTSKIAATFVVLALASSAQADKIVGKIDFTGTAVLDNNDLTQASQVNSWSGLAASQATGSFAPVVTFTESQASIPAFSTPPSVVTIKSPWSFNSFGLTPFWEVKDASNNLLFAFDLTSSAKNAGSNSTFLDVSGTGFVYGSGFDKTFGTWTFNITNAAKDGNFSFQSSTASVPDGGSTVALLGLSFLGLGGVSRLLRRK